MFWERESIKKNRDIINSNYDISKYSYLINNNIKKSTSSIAKLSPRGIPIDYIKKNIMNPLGIRQYINNYDDSIASRNISAPENIGTTSLKDLSKIKEIYEKKKLLDLKFKELVSNN